MLLLTFSLSKQKRSALLRSSQYLLYSIQLDLLFSEDNGKKDELLLSYLHCFPDIFPLLLTLSLYSSHQRKSGKEKESDKAEDNIRIKQRAMVDNLSVFLIDPACSICDHNQEQKDSIRNQKRGQKDVLDSLFLAKMLHFLLRFIFLF